VEIDCTALGATCAEPRNLAVSHSGSLVAVPFRKSNNVLLLDAATQKFTKEITGASFDEPYALSFTADDSAIWVVNKKGGGSTVGSITIIDVASSSVSATIDDAAFSSPEGITIAAGKAYVANRGNGTVTVVNVATKAVTKTLTIGGDPRFAVATPDGGTVFVSTDGPPVAKIKTSDDTLDGTIDVPNSRNIAVSPDGKYLFTNLNSVTPSAVAAIEIATGNITNISLTNAASIYGVAVLRNGKLGLATSEKGQVYAFDPKSLTEVTAGFYPVSVGQTPRAIAAD
jgi:YVTN family beta-propeller protein